MNTANINTLWSSLIIEELIRNGIYYFCISPGSRSAPLTVAVAENSRAKSIICFDERGAAFHALGYARATGKAAALICTSGTAAANYFPAVIEASVDAVPMIVLTADRPPELRQTGANQTIDQVKLFGKYVNWEFDLPCPDENISPRMVLTTVDQAVSRSCGIPAGPVHINCMFREPLAPADQPANGDYLQTLSKWEEEDSPFTKYQLPLQTAYPSALEEVADIINNAKRGIIVVGKLSSIAQSKSILELAQKINFPVFPDINSGLRFQLSGKNFIPHYDQILLTEELGQKFAPDTILQFGGRITSKRLLKFIDRTAPKNYIQVLMGPQRYDPQHNATLHIESEIEAFCKSLLRMVAPNAKTPWLTSLVESSNVVGSLLDAYANPEHAISEISASRIISQLIPEKSALFLGSSMPVRDMDMFASTNGAIIPVAANRGASGIDGTLASATGFAVGHDLPVTLILGDLAMIHDLNSLALLRSIQQQLIIIIINNQGSGIFSFLPIAEFNAVFEKYFGTPHELTFRKAAEMFSIDYHHPRRNMDLRKTYQEILMNGKPAIIEVHTDRRENIELHQKIADRIRIAFQS